VGIDFGITAKYNCKQTIWLVFRDLGIPLSIRDTDDYTGLLQCQTLVCSKIKIFHFLMSKPHDPHSAFSLVRMSVTACRPNFGAP